MDNFGENGMNKKYKEASTDTIYLAGAKFKLYKGEKELGEYTTDTNGKITITGLYQYIEGKDEEAAARTKRRRCSRCH